VIAPVARYYAEKLAHHGSSARGVDWNNEASQHLRFDQLLTLLAHESECVILDYGCGYGALAERLICGPWKFRYIGFDVCEPMIVAARRAVRDERCTFTSRRDELPQVDFAVASGIFNVKLDAEEGSWEEHVLQTIAALGNYSRKGFAFNMLTRYADPQLMRQYLYYADPGRYFRLCKERYARNVSLLHDYDLFEFTVIVRLGTQPKMLAG
jgi:SAM-dependent methyltransferase